MKTDNIFSIKNSFNILISSNSQLTHKSDALWHLTQIIFLLPMVYITWYRFKRQLANENYIEKTKEFPCYKIDACIKIYMSFGIIYYISQILLIQKEDLFYLPQITVFFIFHYCLILYGALYSLFEIRYYPWFVIFPMTLNSILLVFPNKTWLNYVYFLAMVIAYYGLDNPPYKNRENYNKIKRFLLVFTITIVGTYLVKSRMLRA
jgi:hypothetical protein